MCGKKHQGQKEVLSSEKSNNNITIHPLLDAFRYGFKFLPNKLTIQDDFFVLSICFCPRKKSKAPIYFERRHKPSFLEDNFNTKYCLVGLLSGSKRETRQERI